MDNWNELLKEVITFNSVEEFWGVYVGHSIDDIAMHVRLEANLGAENAQNNVAPVSELALKSDYHLFKKGIRPEWEDLANKHGGKWSYLFRDRRNVPIDELWLHVMLAAIGENLEQDGDGELMGVIVNVRKAFYRIGLWTRTTGKAIPGRGEGDVAGGKGRSPEKGREVLTRIGKNFKEVLKLKDSDQVEFSSHTESAHAGSTRARARLFA